MEKIYGAKPKAAAHSAPGVQNDIRSFLIKAGKPAFVPETFVGFDHAFHLIIALGGIPSYPTLADGASPICAYEADIDSLIAELKSRNIHAAELIPIRNTPEVLAKYATSFRDAGFVVTAGTEHNTLDLLPIKPACLNGTAIPDDIQDIFWEGACVIAAHQYLVASGKLGFVNNDGNPNPAYSTSDERIKAFASIGAATINKFRSRN